MEMKWDVVIIGSGLAGYTAANYLSEKKKRVLMVEQNKHIGGRAKTDEIKNQYFNIGPHALYKKGPAASILRQLGIQLPGQGPKTEGLILNKSHSYIAPFGPKGVISTNYLTLKEKLEWVKIMTSIQKVNLNELSNLTFQEWVRHASKSENIQSLIYTLGRLSTYTDAPNLTSAKVILNHLIGALSGVIYIDYGWQTIIDQLHQLAVDSGVNVKNNIKIKTIEKKDLFYLTSSKGETILAEQVLYTGDPHTLNQLTMNQLEEKLFLETIEPIKASTLDVALTNLPNPKQTFAMGLDQPIYYSLHSNYASLSDDGDSHVLHVLKYQSSNALLDSETIKNELEQFLERIQPGWREYKIVSRLIPNITVNHRLPKIGDESKFVKQETSISNLFTAGDWTSQQYILSDGAVLSGKRAALEMIHKGEHS